MTQTATLHTPLCEVLGIAHPIIQGAFGPWSKPELVAAVSEAGAIGSVGTATMPPDEVRAQINRVRELTNRPFVVNHTARPFIEEVFAVILEAAPKAISFAIGDPGELPARAHDVGAVFVQQVHTVAQAESAAEAGADVIIAQGGEAGGFSGFVGTMALVPQVVDAVAPVPVAAAGGIADGRGLAAALVLGAAGINIGTRFLAAEEAGIAAEWQERIIAASSEETVKVDFANAVFPSAGPQGFDTQPRVLSTDFVEEWRGRADAAAAEGERLSAALMEALRGGRAHELVPFTGQTAGMIDDVLPAREIVEALVRGAIEALARGGG